MAHFVIWSKSNRMMRAASSGRGRNWACQSLRSPGQRFEVNEMFESEASQRLPMDSRISGWIWKAYTWALAKSLDPWSKKIQKSCNRLPFLPRLRLRTSWQPRLAFALWWNCTALCAVACGTIFQSSKLVVGCAEKMRRRIAESRLVQKISISGTN